jgi:hypothetical protein
MKYICIHKPMQAFVRGHFCRSEGKAHTYKQHDTMKTAIIQSKGERGEGGGEGEEGDVLPSCTFNFG